MKIVLKTLKWIVISILGLILLINIYIIAQSKLKPNRVPSVFGYKPFAVLSGSMQPNIMVGDLIFIKKTDINKLKKNDIIAFRDKDNLVTTHRIIKVVKKGNEKCFETKGDSNNVKDEELACKKNIEGKYAKRYAKLGNFILFIQKPLGFTVMMMTLFIICVLIYIIQDKTSSKKEKKMSEAELKEFEEFKKAKELAKMQEDNDSSNLNQL